MVSFVPQPVEDELEGSPLVERLHLHDGTLLTQDHFRLEQLYHRSRLSRVLSMLHGYGTIAGLDVGFNPPAGGADVEIEVQPGVAADRLGRLLELRQRSCLTIATWFDQTVETTDGLARINAGLRAAGGGLPDHVVADVYMSFAGCSRAPEPAFATGNADTLDGVQPSRVLEAARLSLLVRAQGDDRLPQSIVSHAVPGSPPTIDSIRDFKRLEGWNALQPDTEPFQLPSGSTVTEHDVTVQNGTEVFLARLVLPFLPDGDGVPRFDAAVNLDQPGLIPAQDDRPYCYSAAEILLLTNEIRR